QGASELLFSRCPIFVRTKVTLVLRIASNGQFELNLLEAVGLKNLDRKVETVCDLSVDLIRTNEKVSIVNRESTNTHQAVQRARQFGTIHRAHLRIPLRK